MSSTKKPESQTYAIDNWAESFTGLISRRNFFLLTLAASISSQARTHGATLRKDVPRRVLGRTGEKVSIIGLGGYHAGSPDERDGIRIIQSALDSGINFLDNCWDYHNGESEVRMGKALRGGYRDKAFLMTKIDGRDRQTAQKQIDDSLRRLQTDHIDLMQIHEVIRSTDPTACFRANGAIEALLASKKAGKIRFIGFTGHKSPEIHLQMLKTAFAHNFTFDTVQMPLNVMDAHYDSFEKLVLPVLQEHNIGVIGMKPLGGGVILRSGVVSAQECLRYALSLKTSVVVTGCESMENLNQALEAAQNFVELTPSEKLALIVKTAKVAQNGQFELYKSSEVFDGTTKHPEWLG
jgi:aryl-alcohol dehydrogenase-like predicted oxidoreductase